MLVGVTGFGSVWRRRIRDHERDRRRFVRASYFNTTGVMLNGRLVKGRKIAGHVRLDGVSGFNPDYPSRRSVRCSSAPSRAFGKARTKCCFDVCCALRRNRTTSWL